MDVHASPAALPAWQACLRAFQVRCRRPEGAAALARSTTGRLTERPNKHGETMAPAVPGTSAPRVPACRTNRPWAEADLNRQRVPKMMAEATTDDGVLVCDDTGFPTQGKASVGVARQYAGTLGQVGHGQIAVTCGATDPQAMWPGAVRLYVPKPWAQDPTRRQPARVPVAVSFQTTPASALPRLDQARAWGGPHRCGIAEADDGDHPNVWAGLEARQERDVVAVRTDFQVTGGRAATTLVWRTAARLQRGPRWQWGPLRWRQGRQGWRRQKVVAVRGGRVTRDRQRHEGWRVGERAPRGQPAERQCSWSNRPATAALAELAGYGHRRDAVEPCHAAATGDVGGDHDQGRLWPGFHRHAVTVLLAYCVLVWLEGHQRRRQPRQGRPRDPVSPAARSVPTLAASGPPRGRSVAAPPSRPLVGHNGSVHRPLLTAVLTK
jgi:SRSO17 transposase